MEMEKVLTEEQVLQLDRDIVAFLRKGGFGRLRRWMAATPDEIAARKLAGYVAGSIQKRLLDAWRAPEP